MEGKKNFSQSEVVLRDLEFTDVPVLHSGSGQICCTRLSKTAGVAALR
jgi:hypothetical protein